MQSDFQLAEYMSQSIQSIIHSAARASIQNPKESAFLFKYLLESKKAEKIRVKYEKEGKHIPPFLIASITTNCNLSCKGCYARACPSHSALEDPCCLTPDHWRRIFQEAKQIGVSFILLAGGEPMMQKEVIRCAGECSSIIFPIFTNGTMIGSEELLLFDKKRNLVPILSLEGGEAETDARRGSGIYQVLLKVMEQFKKKGIFFGVSITVTAANNSLVTRDDFIESLKRQGCKTVFFVEYVPVDGVSKGLVLSREESDAIDRDVAHLRQRHPEMVFLSFPGDEKYSGGCLAAGRGFFHINAGGGAEPCPFSPYSETNLKDAALLEVLSSPFFQKLAESGLLQQEHEGGCVLFQKDKEVKELLG
ncbi:radical SAM protein [Sinanaerobacter chloroacetimidivorans]|jgi:MoaA/NifB/PqqE/SkfB family radical SAM enzyme|uniref:Radical SAM protein n=1 Tax=Sinanaerobacter chloroacetimidivorans TaxID=2818044 RepID=A0A8J8B3E6_9FIRM|nr:radical SAM protein [Sinanaerobacter chloroacetimidivorans]MBR0598240.1 radical SAM protein [Sinanaerobacter chloroacetimidivorans]